MDERTTKSAVGANHPESSERTPDYILVIHPRADMGALSEAIQRLKVKKLGRKGWERYVRESVASYIHGDIAVIFSRPGLPAMGEVAQQMCPQLIVNGENLRCEPS